jgi:photosystem II stability/assembly factor-like uncharacterized protein
MRVAGRGNRLARTALVLILGLGAVRADSIVFEQGAATRYLANSADPGIEMTWTAPDFVEGPGWSDGTFGIGFEDGPPGEGAEALIETSVPVGTRSVYTRTTFEVSDPSSVFSLFLGLDYDDGVVAWLNGVEVYRSPEMWYRPTVWDTAVGLHESSNGAVPDYEPLRDLSSAALPQLVAGENVLAMGVWSQGLDDMLLVPQLRLNRLLTRKPYLQRQSASSVVIRWTTGTPTISRVEYGTAVGNLDFSVQSGTTTTEHEVELTGLDPNTRYYYSVGTPTERLAGGDPQHYVETPPETGTPKPTRIWVLGDSGLGNVPATDVRDAYREYTGSADTQLWLMLGDNAYPSGTEVQYQDNLFDIYSEILPRAALWPTIGNHDLPDGLVDTWPYFDLFTLPMQGEAGGVMSGTESYYAFDYANIHFVVLDSMHSSRAVGSPMLTWLASDLAATDQEWIVAFWHHPPYSKGGHDSDNPEGAQFQLQEMRENVLPILDAHGVDLVLSGHSHSYERSYLVDGHYGFSDSFDQSMLIDGGDGNEQGDGAYQSQGPGVVYGVAGSSSQTTVGSAIDLGGTGPNHPVMHVSLLELGSMVLEINGNRLDARFLSDAGEIRDEFTLIKGAPPVAPLAEFQADPLVALAPAMVSFTDLTQNGPTVWDWDFEDDGTVDSRAPSPTHQYSSPGEYSVRLAVANSAGSDALLKTGYVCVTGGSPEPIADLVLRPDKATINWVPDAGSMDYDVVRGDLIVLRAGGSFEGSQRTCFATGQQPFLVDAATPLSGAGFYYLVRGSNCGPEVGTYDSTGPHQAASRDLALQGLGAACACPDGSDADADGFCTGYDNCPETGSDDLGDQDADGIGDVCDGCPEDPFKSDPGACGCGFVEVDTDGDTVPDCVDGCPADPDKDDPGFCGCGNPDDDTDGDQTVDCLDDCPMDPEKTEPGLCGCGDAECWLHLGSGSTEDLVAVDFPAGGPIGYAVGRSGTVLKTIDAGYTWSPQASGTLEHIRDVDFPVDALTGFAVGERLTVLKTVDGGANWVPLVNPNSIDLAGVDFPVDALTGFAVGENGLIIKTTNGGNDWSVLSSTTVQPLESIHFPVDTTTGYAAGQNGKIVKTDNGGLSWTQLNSGTTVDLVSIVFPSDTLTGYAVGDLGTILKTTDGGSAWIPQDSGVTRSLRGLDFSAAGTIGFVVGQSGSILRTDADGTAWTSETSPTSRTLRSFQITADETRGYAVGDLGTILILIRE